MTCRDVREHLTDLSRGHLPAELAANVRAHLVGCPACSQALRARSSSGRSSGGTRRASPHRLRCRRGFRQRCEMPSDLLGWSGTTWVRHHPWLKGSWSARWPPSPSCGWAAPGWRGTPCPTGCRGGGRARRVRAGSHASAGPRCRGTAQEGTIRGGISAGAGVPGRRRGAADLGRGHRGARQRGRWPWSTGTDPNATRRCW